MVPSNIYNCKSTKNIVKGACFFYFIWKMINQAPKENGKTDSASGSSFRMSSELNLHLNILADRYTTVDLE